MLICGLPYLVLLGFFVTFVKGEYFLYGHEICNFPGKDVNKSEYIYNVYFNSAKFLQYNSSLNRYTGYTKFGVQMANKFNNNPEQLAWRKHTVLSLCESNFPVFHRNLWDKIVEPSVHLMPVTRGNGRHPAVLRCSAYRFYPKHIKISWWRNGEEVTLNIMSEELADGDWYYQFHSYLEYIPTPGEKISCIVEHSSLLEPKVLDWDPSMPESERNKITIGVSGFVLGLAFTAAGYIYYRKNCNDSLL